MKLTWYGHSCFKLETADGSVVFDPYAPGSVPGLTLPALEADRVICSHGHGDHAYKEAVTLTGKTPTFIVQTVASFHDDVRGAKRGSNHITIIQSQGLRLAHMGDLGHLPDPTQLAAINEVDVMLIPVGGFYTIDAAQAKQVIDMIGPRHVIPMHYRKGSVGYDEIGTLDDFLALWSAQDVQLLDTNVIEDLAKLDKFIVVPALPR